MQRYHLEVICDRCEGCEFFEKPEGASGRDTARAAGWLYLANGEQICAACQIAPARTLSHEIPLEGRYRGAVRYLSLAPRAREGGAEGEGFFRPGFGHYLFESAMWPVRKKEQPWSVFTRWMRSLSGHFTGNRGCD